MLISGRQFSLENLGNVFEVVVRKADVNDSLLQLSLLVDDVHHFTNLAPQLFFLDLRLLVVVQQNVVLLL
jgi:hypothetical protein